MTSACWRRSRRAPRPRPPRRSRRSDGDRDWRRPRRERTRWARELHDETLQSRAAVRPGLAPQLRGSADAGAVPETARQSVQALDREPRTLRALITDLRPAALDDVGVQLNVSLAYERGDRPDRLASDVETTVYRITQEALKQRPAPRRGRPRVGRSRRGRDRRARDNPRRWTRL